MDNFAIFLKSKKIRRFVLVIGISAATGPPPPRWGSTRFSTSHILHWLQSSPLKEGRTGLDWKESEGGRREDAVPMPSMLQISNDHITVSENELCGVKSRQGYRRVVTA